MAVGDGSIVGDALGCGDGLGRTGVNEGEGRTVVAGWVKVTVAATTRVTVGGSGVVSALTAMAARAPRLAKASARHRMTVQKPTKSRTILRTWLRGTRLRSNSIGIRVYHRGIQRMSIHTLEQMQGICRGETAGNVVGQVDNKALLDAIFY